MSVSRVKKKKKKNKMTRPQIKGGHYGVTSGGMICFKKNFLYPVLDDFIYYCWAHKT